MLTLLYITALHRHPAPETLEAGRGFGPRAAGRGVGCVAEGGGEGREGREGVYGGTFDESGCWE